MVINPKSRVSECSALVWVASSEEGHGVLAHPSSHDPSTGDCTGRLDSLLAPFTNLDHHMPHEDFSCVRHRRTCMPELKNCDGCRVHSKFL